MHACSISHMCLYMVKVVHRRVHTYMCVRVIICECVFEFVYVFVYGKVCGLCRSYYLRCSR